MKKVSFYTLGCKLNFSESSTIARQLTDIGYERCEFNEAADVYVINTCSVTDNADKKCRKVVKEALKFNRYAKVVVIGCYAQLKPKEISEIPGVNMVLGASEKFNLAEHLETLHDDSEVLIKDGNIKETNIFVPGFSQGDRTRTFLKVQDGCDYFCSFCTIPLARGKSRSNTLKETIDSAKEAIQAGAQEIVLTGVNIGDFGVQSGETFYDLIVALDALDAVKRFRISSIEPNLLEDRIIEFVAKSQKFVPHFHIPLQSGSDELLQKMRRKYLRELYTQRVQKIFETMPNCAVGVDVIVGFPGETHEHFLETYNYLKDLGVSYLHVFPYSERANTTARKLANAVPQKERMERSKMLRSLSVKLKRAFYEKQIGLSHEVLFEQEEQDGFMYGFTDNYTRVRMPYDPLQVNELIAVEIQGFSNDEAMVATELHELELSHESK
jgi:threonylcarbamoyladenosine tRNA methylthiotransferase MtaB